MARPWDNLNEDDFERDWGSNTSPNGVKLDEFYDTLRANGWDREGDDEIISTMWRLGCERLKDDPGLLQKMMSAPAKTSDSRANILVDLRERFGGHFGQTTASIETERFADYWEFRANMEASGWTAEGDDKLIDAIFSIPNRITNRWNDTTFRDDISKDVVRTATNRRRAMDRVLSYISDLDKYGKEDLKPEVVDLITKTRDELKPLEEEEKRQTELAANPNLRRLITVMVKKGLDGLDFIGNERGELFGTGFKEEDFAIGKDASDNLKKQIDALDIDLESVNNEPDAVKQAISDKFAAIVKDTLKKEIKGTDDVTNLNDIIHYKAVFDPYEDYNSVAEFKKSLCDAVLRFAQSKKREEMLAEDKEKNPAKYARIDNIKDAAEKIEAVADQIKAERNKPFYEAIKNGTGDPDKIPVYLVEGFRRYPVEFEQLNEVQITELESAMDKVLSLGIEKMSDIYAEANVADEYWNHYSSPVTAQDIKDLQDKFTSMKEKGLNIDEFKGTGAYDFFLSRHMIKKGSGYDPLKIAEKSLSGKYSVDDLKDTLSAHNFKQIMNCLDEIDKSYDEKGDGVANVDADHLAEWFRSNGYDMLTNSLIAANGFDKKIVNGKEMKFIKLGEAIDESKIDRDKADMPEYTLLVNCAKEAVELYQKNKFEFDKAFSDMYTMRHGEGLALKGIKETLRHIDETPELYKDLNRFRHLLYEMKKCDQDVCKIMDIKSKKPVLVDPLPADTEFSKDMKDKEKAILDNCINMLYEPSTRVHKNSSEYKRLMESINKIKTGLDKDYPNNEEARRAYVENVKKALFAIEKYCVHKAKDGIKEDATRDKLIACERVEKLLSTRYKTLEKADYEAKMEGVADLFNVEVDKKLSGDDFVYAKAVGKIENMRKRLKEMANEIGQDNGRKSVSVGGAKKDQVTVQRNSL